MRSLQKLRQRQTSSHLQAAAPPKTTSNPCKANNNQRGRPARAEPPPVSPLALVSETPESHTTNEHLSQNASTCLARGRGKQTERNERSGRCLDADMTQRKRQNTRVTPPLRSKLPQLRSARNCQSRAAKKTHVTLFCPSSPQDTPLSPTKSQPGEGTPKPRRGRPPKPRLSSTPQHSRPSPCLPPISPVSPEKSVCCLDPKALQRKRQRKKLEQKVCDTPLVRRQRKKRSAKAELPRTQRIQTRLVLDEAELHDPEETLSSSDLSIELSVQEENLSLAHTLSIEEEEEEEEEEELPSFLQQIRQKPSIKEGLCVWCKLRKYPFWPAVVKSVNHKTKKASIVFVDQFLVDKKSMCKGLTVSLRTLKPFHCEESRHFVNMAKEEYGEYFLMCLALISDYNIRIGCGSFVGSVLDYIADDISQPLRSEFLKVSSDILSPTQSLMNQIRESELQEHNEHPEHLQDLQVIKKVLPDRTQAARNRANQKLVDFIVTKKGAQDRLLAVISGSQESRWLQVLRNCSTAMVEQVYLEDDEQVFKVYYYLEELWQSAAKANRQLEKSDHIRFILDVLFPEALIYAISSVDSISLDKAEEKYFQGPRHSNREKQEFDLLIEQQMRLKADDTL